MAGVCAIPGKVGKKWFGHGMLFVLLLSSPLMTWSQAKKADAKAPVTAFPATKVNSVLPEWLSISGEYRMRMEDHTAYKFVPDADDAFLLSRLRLNLSLTPKSWLNIFVQAQDAHGLGIESAHATNSINDAFDLRQAYVQLSPAKWLRVRTGRQEFRFGGERLIGASDWSNTSRVFDGIRATLGTEPNHVDVFTSSVVVNDVIHFDDHQGGLTFHGIHGSFTRLLPKATVEPYLLWKALPLVKSEAGVAGDESLFTYGVRLVGKLPHGFDYGAEGVWQKGYLSRDDIAASGAYAVVGYTAARVHWSPRLSAQYDYASGDRALKDGKVGTFDQLYPASHYLFGLVDLFGWRNLRQMRAGVEVKPTGPLKVGFDYRVLHLASRFDGLYGSSGSVLVKAPKDGASSSQVGRAIDVQMKVQLRKNVETGAGVGHLFAGKFLEQNSGGSPSSCAYSFATYRF